MEERRRRFPDVIRMVEETMAGRGLSQSSVRTNAIQNACDNGAALRLADSWTDLKNVLAAVGVSFTEQLAGDLKGQIGQHVALDDLVRIVNGAAGDDRRFDSSVEHQLRKIGSDIDLYCANLKRAAEQQGRTGPPIYNFHGPVAAVQTGPYSTASVVQLFGAEHRQALANALDELRARVEALETTVMPQGRGRRAHRRGAQRGAPGTAEPPASWFGAVRNRYSSPNGCCHRGGLSRAEGCGRDGRHRAPMSA